MDITIEAARSSGGEVRIQMPVWLAEYLVSVITSSESDCAPALDPLLDAMIAIGFDIEEDAE